MPPSSTLAMLGWSIRARAWRSCSKRCSTALESMPALMSLSATLRLTGSVCLATQTSPMPPSPIVFDQRVAAGDDRARPGDRRLVVESSPLSARVSRLGELLNSPVASGLATTGRLEAACAASNASTAARICGWPAQATSRNAARSAGDLLNASWKRDCSVIGCSPKRTCGDSLARGQGWPLSKVLCFFPKLCLKKRSAGRRRHVMVRLPAPDSF